MAANRQHGGREVMRKGFISAEHKNCHKKKPRVLSCVIGESFTYFWRLYASNSLPLPMDLFSILDKV